MSTIEMRCFIQAKAQLLRCEAEMQGMIALNQSRTQEGKTIAYTDEDFFNLEKKYDLINIGHWE